MPFNGLRYDNVNLTFFYNYGAHFLPIAHYTVHGFYQGMGKTAHKRDVTNTHGFPWVDASDAVSNGSMAVFRVELSTKISFLFPLEPPLSTAVDSSTSAATNPLPPPTAPSPNPLTQIHHFLSIKLTSKNYLLWRTQILPLIKGLRLLSYIDGTNWPPPSHHLNAESNTIVPNPAFSQWEQQDNLLMSALLNSLTEEVVRLVVGASTSHAIWSTLESDFASPSQACIMQFRLQLQNIKQGDSSFQSYLQQAKSVADELAATG
ncbi:hypothetical protein BUALT_Bualt14G0054500 [Buddleja alternifolia]|uniref:Retrotransposon Copia-like N-terminal domain-containing protein n=1 Tax=Buddleja alternifolia TaxID=168488 RepID=A0AAV6WLR3_9LAMI|nr:hypothetical protein BUALT_Bualt14G0054500 [Buddleja alternifolia]